jgi:hypothetical protein
MFLRFSDLGNEAIRIFFLTNFPGNVTMELKMPCPRCRSRFLEKRKGYEKNRFIGNVQEESKGSPLS